MQLLLASAALDPGLTEPGGEHDVVADSEFGALAQHVEHGRGRQHHVDEVDRGPEVGEALVRGAAVDLGGAGADQVDRAR